MRYIHLLTYLLTRRLLDVLQTWARFGERVFTVASPLMWNEIDYSQHKEHFLTT